MITIDVQKQFPLASIDFSLVLHSRRVVIFGPSGSGKSTLLKLVAGLCRPDKGRIVMDGRIIVDTESEQNIPVHHRQFGYLPQDYTLFPHLNVKENILYGLKARKVPFLEKEFEKLVKMIGIAETLNCMAHELSGGQQQRVALARTMLIKPKVLLLDEPFSGLDTTIRELLRELVSELTDEQNFPTLLVTHDIEEAMAFGIEIVIIHRGRILESGKKDLIFQSPKFVETARLLGFQVWPLRKRNGSQLHTCGGETFQFSGLGERDGQYICIRPENIMLIREDRPLSKKYRENLVSGVICRIHHRARYIRLMFQSSRGEDYLIHIPEHVLRVMNIYEGKAVQISLKCESLVLCK